MPTISVIVPVYKVEKYIHRCVDSILAQTFTDFELILVDDGSPDNCGAICDEYAARDSRIHVIHQENGGLSAARNAGIDWSFANSDSQWLTFIDSDDWVHPEYLERLLDAVVTNNVSISICGFVETEGEVPPIEERDMIPILWGTEDFLVEKPALAVVAYCKLYRRDCFLEIRYPLGKIHEDEFVTYRALFQYDKLAVIPAEMYFYYQHSGSIMHQAFTIKKYDALEGFAQQAAFYKEHSPKLYDIVCKRIQFYTAEYSLKARKARIYTKVPSQYKISFRKAAQILLKLLGENRFESLMFRYYPNYIKFRAVVRKLRQILN